MCVCVCVKIKDIGHSSHGTASSPSILSSVENIREKLATTGLKKKRVQARKGLVKMSGQEIFWASPLSSPVRLMTRLVKYLKEIYCMISQ